MEGSAGSPERLPRHTGIVLAGGRARRFGADKLAAPLQGRPLLWHALAAVAPLVDELLVVVGAEVPPPVMPDIGPAPRLVRDPVPDAGPLVALLAGLRAAAAPAAIVVGGDMPLVRRAILELLRDRVAGGQRTAMAALLDAGRLRPLPAAMAVGRSRLLAERLVAGGERSLLSLADALDADRVDERLWRGIDADGDSLRDVDTPADLARLEHGSSRRS